jgi:hypothetical protein
MRIWGFCSVKWGKNPGNYLLPSLKGKGRGRGQRQTIEGGNLSYLVSIQEIFSKER